MDTSSDLACKHMGIKIHFLDIIIYCYVTVLISLTFMIYVIKEIKWESGVSVTPNNEGLSDKPSIICLSQILYLISH